jgi:hypothetical protein
MSEMNHPDASAKVEEFTIAVPYHGIARIAGVLPLYGDLVDR